MLFGYLDIAKILIEAKEDKGLNQEDKKVKRDKRKFGDSWEVKPGFSGMSSHETRKMLHGRSQRRHRGQSTPEDREWFAKKDAEKTKPITKASSKQVIAGRKRSIKTRLEKEKAKPRLKLPESIMARMEQIDELSRRTKDSYIAKRGSQMSSMKYGPDKNYTRLSGRKQANAVKGIKRARK